MSAMKHLYTLAQEIIEVTDQINEYREGLDLGGFWDEVAATAKLALLRERLFNLTAEFATYPQNLRIESVKAAEEMMHSA